MCVCFIPQPKKKIIIKETEKKTRTPLLKISQKQYWGCSDCG